MVMLYRNLDFTILQFDSSFFNDVGIIFGSGKEVFFIRNGTTFTPADARIDDTLVQNGDGSYTYTTKAKPDAPLLGVNRASNRPSAHDYKLFIKEKQIGAAILGLLAAIFLFVITERCRHNIEVLVDRFVTKEGYILSLR